VCDLRALVSKGFYVEHTHTQKCLAVEHTWYKVLLFSYTKKDIQRTERRAVCVDQ